DRGLLTICIKRGRDPMPTDPVTHGGFQFTRRHALILSIHLLVLFGAITPVLERSVRFSTLSVVLSAFVLTPPLLALLVMLIDRPGPVKNWGFLLLLVLLYPALAVSHDVQAVSDYLTSGKVPNAQVLFLINAMVLPVSIVYAARMMPRPCPGCCMRTLVPLRE